MFVISVNAVYEAVPVSWKLFEFPKQPKRLLFIFRIRFGMPTRLVLFDLKSWRRKENHGGGWNLTLFLWHDTSVLTLFCVCMYKDRHRDNLDCFSS